MTVRCKFRLIERTTTDWGGIRLRFEARYDQSIPEDQRFCKETPSGHLEMTVRSSDNAAASFELGKDYYLDTTPVPEPVAEKTLETKAA